MSGIKPIGQNTEPSQVLQERTPNTRSETQALERLDVFARQESMEELSPIFKHSGLFMPGQASLLEENQGVIETKYGDVKVISLEDMDTILSDPKLQEPEPEDLVSMTAAFNVAFYGNWEPEAMSLEFEQAHQTLKDNDIKPGTVLMVLEANYAPHEERFVDWVTMRMEAWNDRGNYCHLSEKNELSMTMIVAKIWYDRLSGASKAKVNDLFRKTHEIINSEGFAFEKDHRGGMGAFSMMGRIFSQQILYSRVRQLANKEEKPFKLSAELFSKKADPKETYSAIKESSILYGDVDKRWADSIWNLLNDHSDELIGLEDYWSLMRQFLTEHPQYIEAFIQRQDYWEAKLIDDIEEGYYTKGFGLLHCYDDLVRSDLVPEKNKLQVYHYILKFHSSEKFSAFLAIEDVSQLEEELMSYYILDQIKENPEICNSALDLGHDLLMVRLEEWRADDFISFLQEILPEEIQGRLNLSWQVIRLMLDQDRDSVAWFLNQSQGVQDIDEESIENDPLWGFLWERLAPQGTQLIFLDYYSSSDKYKVAISEVPDMLIDTGHEDVLEEFYQANHPYKTIYNLPDSIRPTGKGLSFVSIDEFGNPRHIKHLDKKHVRNINGDSGYWADVEKDDRATHGVSTSSLAVGREQGLAPDAKLYLAPVDIDGETLARTLLRNLKDVVEQKKRDPSIAVTGMSLGLEIPHAFRDQALQSETFQELCVVCETLHEMGVALIASSGNAGSDELINMIGFLPHVQLIGSAHSRLTEDFGDDVASYYTTGGDTVNPVRFYAQADPLLMPKREGEFAWHWDSGTSFAQPSFSGVCLLMKDVNPELSWDDIYTILEETSDSGGDINLWGEEMRDPITVINPMAALSQAASLPGSRYKGNRLERLLEALE